MELSEQQRERFLEVLWGFYARSARRLPWREPEPEPDGEFNPYKIMVSELMLQQTQVPRVVPKYEAFLGRFGSVQSLADADLGDVLRAWQGLGYNRRAKFLWAAAQAIVSQGAFPDTPEGLTALPGIGPNTAGAILAYAFNKPALFIETNVRTVYIHHFCKGRTDITDSAVRGLLEQTLDREQPREFYWALMDYGSHLKATVGNPNAASRHYVRQSTFEGSRRQLRGRIIRELGGGSQTFANLRISIPDERLKGVLLDLTREGLIRAEDGIYTL